MLGFSRDELNHILSVEGNNPNNWIERYHLDVSRDCPASNCISMSQRM